MARVDQREIDAAMEEDIIITEEINQALADSFEQMLAQSGDGINWQAEQQDLDLYLGRAKDSVRETFGENSIEMEAVEDVTENVHDSVERVRADYEEKIASIVKQNEDLQKRIGELEQKLINEQNLSLKMQQIVREELEKDKISTKIKNLVKSVKNYFHDMKENVKGFAEKCKDTVKDMGQEILVAADAANIKTAQAEINHYNNMIELEKEQIADLQAEYKQVQDMALEMSKAKQGLKNAFKIAFHKEPDHSEPKIDSKMAKKKLAKLEAKISAHQEKINGYKESIKGLDAQIQETKDYWKEQGKSVSLEERIKQKEQEIAKESQTQTKTEKTVDEQEH